MIIFVTACSQNHSKSMIQFLNSLHNNSGQIFKCYVYDLGDLSNEYKEKLIKNFPNIILKIFDYSKYPSYFNIQINAGEYAWKPNIINEVLEELNINTEEDNYLFWCDAGDKINYDINTLLNIIKNNKIYSPSSSGNVSTWTYYKVLEYFDIQNNREILNFQNKNAAVIGFYINSDEVRELIKNFAKYAKIKEAICPEGSSRLNHRQDQALFTILYYFFIKKYNYNHDNSVYSITYHNDCD